MLRGGRRCRCTFDPLCLSDAVRASHRLQVVLGVPIGVEEHARVGGGEVDAHPARTRREEECEDVGARFAVAIDGRLASIAGDAAVDALI